MKELPERYRQFRTEFPEISEAYDHLGRMLAEAGPLDEKRVQLIKLAMAVASRARAARGSKVGAEWTRKGTKS
jgi:4-carboxymuconolactone decarboxylase